MYFYHDLTPIPGDKIKRTVFRADLAPIPATLEIELRLDDGNRDYLKEGLDIYAGPDRAYRCVLAQLYRRNAEQTGRMLESMHMTCVQRELQPLTFVRERAVYLEDTTLTDIYRACGAQLAKPIIGDVAIPRFTCLIGDTPTFGVAKLFQEHRGVLRVNKDDDLEFMRLESLFEQKPSLVVPANVTEEIESGFIERHEIPWFFGIDETNAFIFGNTDKARHARYKHGSEEDVLRNMSRVLIQAKRLRIDYTVSLRAGDAAKIAGGGGVGNDPLPSNDPVPTWGDDEEDIFTVLTSAGVYSSGTDGLPIEQYTRVWLGSLI